MEPKCGSIYHDGGLLRSARARDAGAMPATRAAREHSRIYCTRICCDRPRGAVVCSIGRQLRSVRPAQRPLTLVAVPGP
jgi:hypothetical protein